MRKVKIWGEWGSPETLEINSEGVIDETAKKVFTRGQCHSLALAICELVDCGWPMYGLITPGANKPTSPGHITVRRPDGEYVDINGPGAFNRYKTFFGDKAELCIVTPEMIKKGLEHFLPLDLESAKPFAKTVLKEHCQVEVA